MVVRDEVSEIFQALADPTRRDIITRVLHGEQSVSELAAHYPMSFAAVQKHVAVLARAVLVRKRRRGREQVVVAEVATIQRVSTLLDDYERLWRQRVQQIDSILSEE